MKTVSLLETLVFYYFIDVASYSAGCDTRKVLGMKKEDEYFHEDYIGMQ